MYDIPIRAILRAARDGVFIRVLRSGKAELMIFIINRHFASFCV